jgi:surface antigen
MLLFQAETPPITSPLIQIVIQQPEVEQPPEEQIYTIEDKIRDNHYNCDESTHWISAENATCLPKRVQTATTARVAEKPVRTAVNGSNSYSSGYCTWYVKNQLSWVPNGWGNANRWASNARSQGYTVSTTPTVGSVAQTSSGALGHVAVVTSVNGDQVTISEMNYRGWNIISSRTVHVSSFVYIR